MVFAKRAKTHAKSFLWGCCHTTGFTRGYSYSTPFGVGKLLLRRRSPERGLLLWPYSSPELEAEDEWGNALAERLARVGGAADSLSESWD